MCLRRLKAYLNPNANTSESGGCTLKEDENPIKPRKDQIASFRYSYMLKQDILFLKQIKKIFHNFNTKQKKCFQCLWKHL